MKAGADIERGRKAYASKRGWKPSIRLISPTGLSLSAQKTSQAAWGGVYE